MQRSLKRKVAIGGAALAAAGFAGGAYAATQNAAPSTRQAFLNDVAKRLHVSPQELTQALEGALTDQLQAAVKAGRLTQAQADQLEQRLKRSGGTPPMPLFGFGPGGPGRFGGPRLHAGGGGLAGRGGGAAAANYLGLTGAQLLQQLSSGKSLAQIATAQGKSVTGLEDAMSKAVRTRLDKLLAAKVITSAQEQRMLSRANARIAHEVNQKGLPFRRGFSPRWRVPNGKPPGNPPAPPGGVPYSPAAPYAPPAPSA